MNVEVLDEQMNAAKGVVWKPHAHGLSSEYRQRDYLVNPDRGIICG